jgi:hypothetical protein
MKSYFKNKPLHEFDCYDDDKSPEEWLVLYKNSVNQTHGHTLVYDDHQ